MVFPKKNSASIAGCVVMAIIFASAFAWRYFCPPCADDFLYRMVYPADDDLYTTLIASWGDIFTAIKNHYFFNNGRFANYLAYVVLYMPRWVEVLFCTLTVAALPLLISLVVKRADGDNRKVLANASALVLTTVMVWLFCPWHNYMQSTDFLLNYAFASDCMLLSMALWQRPQTWRWQNMLWYLPLLLLCSWVHEASTCALIAWAGIDWLENLASPKANRNKKLAGLVAILIGFLLILSSHGIVHRVETDAKGLFGMSWFSMLSSAIVWIYYFLLFVLTLMRKLSWQDWKSHLALVAGTIPGIAIVLIAQPEVRALFFSDILAIAGVALLYWHFCLPHLRRWVRAAITVVGSLLLCAFYWGLAYWTDICYQDYKKVEAEILRTGKPMCFIEIHTPEDIPFYTLGIPYLNTNFFHAMFAAAYYGFPDLAVSYFPKEYANIPVDQWTQVPGVSYLHTVPYCPSVSTEYHITCVSTKLFEPTLFNVTYSDSVHPGNFLYALYKKGADLLKGNRSVIRSLDAVNLGVHMGDTIYGYDFYETSHWFTGRIPANYEKR